MHVLQQVDFPALAEILAGLAGGGVQSEEAAIQGRRIDARVAGGARGARCVHPYGHAPGHAVGIMQVTARVAIVFPAQRAGGGIYRQYVGARSGEVEGPVVEDWGRLKGGTVPVLYPLPELTGAEHPGHLKVAHVLTVDLGEWRIARPAGIPAVGGPACVGSDGPDGARGAEGEEHEQRLQHDGHSISQDGLHSRQPNWVPPPELGRAEDSWDERLQPGDESYWKR